MAKLLIIEGSDAIEAINEDAFKSFNEAYSHNQDLKCDNLVAHQLACIIPYESNLFLNCKYPLRESNLYFNFKTFTSSILNVVNVSNVTSDVVTTNRTLLNLQSIALRYMGTVNYGIKYKPYFIPILAFMQCPNPKLNHVDLGYVKVTDNSIETLFPINMSHENVINGIEIEYVSYIDYYNQHKEYLITLETLLNYE